MFYCVYFFSPFHLKPILALLFSQGLVASCEIFGFPRLLRGSRYSVLSCAVLFPSSGMVFFPSFPDSFSLPLWWIPTCASRPTSNISVLGKHLPSSPCFSSRQSCFLPWFVYTCVLRLLPPEYCGLLCVWRSLFSWELLESETVSFLSLNHWYSVEYWIMAYSCHWKLTTMEGKYV